MKNNYFICILLVFSFLSLSSNSHARSLEVGSGKTYPRLQAAAQQAQPGDTILIFGGIYSGNDAIVNLQGTANQWITILAAEKGAVIYRGGSQAFQMTDTRYVRMSGLIFEQQTGNGINLDDGGTFDTPSHNIIIENCEWRSMGATGNNDELKMSGIDTFTIRNCRFLNGATGGSLIDMVGCHQGIIADNYFENAGSNCIQAKGGSSAITIERNKFINGGERALNIGGSTGLAFFRPAGANYEAKAINVYSNIFVGSLAPIAFVGAIDCFVVNNTIYRPGRWAIRILQETVGNGFLPCGNNHFSENIVVFATGQPAINIGGNTAPESFTFGVNLWYNPDNSAWSGPNTPKPEIRTIRENPRFKDTVSFELTSTSPAIGQGTGIVTPARDFYKKEFAPTSGIVPSRNRSLGAVEYYPPVGVNEVQAITALSVVPTPSHSIVQVMFGTGTSATAPIKIYNALTGEEVTVVVVALENNKLTVDISQLPTGIYYVEHNGQFSGKIVKM
ncbi:MAG: right-handed parallel beta-helix repeat-containing protein [Candidatus Kapaibacterium sp.]